MQPATGAAFLLILGASHACRGKESMTVNGDGHHGDINCVWAVCGRVEVVVANISPAQGGFSQHTVCLEGQASQAEMS
eukprot:scaffold18471_cov16-Prasinocladus_malaysianus.AAC.1